LYAYKLADRHDRAGRAEQAEKLAEIAGSINSDNALEHLRLAFLQLQREEGLYKWAEREYRRVIEIGGPGRDLSLNAQSLMAEMLHDIEHELDAAQALEAMSAAMQENIKQGNAEQNGRSELGTVKARMNYFFACDHAAKGERDQQIKRLEAAIKEDPLDADVLIALYRLPDRSPKEKERTLQLIREAAAEFRKQINLDPDSPENHAPYNQLAWLLSNTAGDYSEALAASLKSLELNPKAAGYMDTLGHCYHALGDFENAVKIQTEAVEREPHSLQMQRMLVVFRDALEKQRQGKNRKQ
jgi:tetratricopeptide (TPR) repeat protein